MAQDKQATKKQKYKIGQILAIPLPDKRFAYGKIFNDLDVGVYDLLTDEIEAVDKVVQHKILFYSAVASATVKNGDFLVIGEQKFPDEESAWAPPMVMGINPDDHSDGAIHIAHKGDVRGGTPDTAKGLDIRAFSQRADLFVNQIVERLVKKKNLKYRYTP